MAKRERDEDDKRDERRERDRKLSERLGIAPATVGGLALMGAPSFVSPLNISTTALANSMLSGDPIRSKAGTPLQEIAEFSGAEVRKIRDFAARQGVGVPILAARREMRGNAYSLPERQSLIDRLTRRLMGDKTYAEALRAQGVLQAEPHIALGQSSVPLAMHEIGHATPLPGGKIPNAVWQEIVSNAKGLPGMLARSLLMGNVLSPPDEDTGSVRRFAYEHAPELVAATQVPNLVEEGRASYHALRGARSTGMGVGQVLKEMAPNFGTYIAGAAVPVIATILARKVIEALHRKGEEIAEVEEEKQAAAIPGTEIKAPGMLRQTASAAWRMGAGPKPKSTIPGGPSAKAKSSPPAKPPSKQAYYKDMVESLYNPQRGYRLAT